MKTNALIFCLIASLLTPAICSAAQPRPGGYISGFIGVSAPKDTTVTTDDFDLNTTFVDDVEFDPGVNVGMTGGYDFGFVRLEGELSYKYAEIKSITDTADNFAFKSVDGDLGVFAMMFNGFFDLHNNSPITPYVGGGISLATLYLSDTHGTDTRGAITNRVLLYTEDYDNVFAYQLGGGLEIALNPILSMDLSYRYFHTDDARFEDNPFQTTKLNFESHNAALGFRLKF